MCRWLAYVGPPTTLDTVLCQPNHSLIDQGLHARFNLGIHSTQATTNGDGFGIGWYTDIATPGRFRDVRPVWNDENFIDLATHISSGFFLAHVRATTERDVQRSNCHPFRHARWLFQHNGEIPGFRTLRRALESGVAQTLYPSRMGSTDSECCLLLALSFGLDESPVTGLARMTGYVEAHRESHGIIEPFTLTAACANGETLYAVRYSSDGASRTLFHSRHHDALTNLDEDYSNVPRGAVVVVSEPLDDMPDHWEEVPEKSILIVNHQGTELLPFEPERMPNWPEF